MYRYLIVFLLTFVVFSFTFQDGYNFFVRGEYEKAAEVFSLLLKEKPDDSKTTLWLGKSYFNLGDQKNAIDVLIKASRLNPNDSEPKELLEQVEYIRKFKKTAEEYYHQGYFFYIKADFESAKKNYWQAILIEPDVPKYHLWHLRCLIGLGELSKARAQLEFAETLKPYENSLSVLKKEDLRNIKADKDYYKQLLSLKDAKNLSPKNAKKEETKVKVTPNIVKKEFDIVSEVVTPGNIPKAVVLDEQIDLDEYISRIPTMDPEKLRKNTADINASAIKRFSF